MLLSCVSSRCSPSAAGPPTELQPTLQSRNLLPGTPGAWRWRSANPSSRAKFAGGERCCRSKLASFAPCWPWCVVRLASLEAWVGAGMMFSTRVVRGPELGSLRTATTPSLSDWSPGFPLPARGRGSSAHTGGLRHALDCGAGSAKLLRLPGVPDAAVGVFCWG